MKLNTKVIIPLMILLLTMLSCSNEGSEDFQDAPNGQYRVVDKICYCAFEENGYIEYWIFDLESESMTVLIIDSEGQQVSSEKFFYGIKGEYLLIGDDSSKYSQKNVSEILELTYLDRPEISDDELVIKLRPY
jgi:hypothetical protein